MVFDPAQLLRERSLQVTAQRMAVLRAVHARPHCRAENVTEEVRAEIGSISRQAVYDALGVLVEKGLIRRIQPAGSPALYEFRTEEDHHHVVCRVCGKMVDVSMTVNPAPSLKAAARESGFRVEEAEVIFTGTCPSCLGGGKGGA
jgi:Fe2+ or Zn2+ uptake regulation protein